MRLNRIALLLTLAALTLSLTYGQDGTAPVPVPLKQTPAPVEPTRPPAAVVTPIPPPVARTTAPPAPATPQPPQPGQSTRATVNMSRMSALQQQMVLATHRGTDWLAGMNGTKGRFLHGWVPALNTPLEGDHYLRQAGAALGLARAARWTQDQRASALATQAILALLDDTVTEKRDDQMLRYTTLPSIVINRLGAAALLVLAINELPAPQKDLLDMSEQLCQYIRRQARPDGSLSSADIQADGTPGPEDADAVLHYPGQALYALMRSQQRNPAPWKIDLVRKALAYYQPWWRQNKAMAFVPWQTAAFTEAYLLTHEKPFADCVYEMNDWLGALQYQQLDPLHRLWLGGFKSWSGGRSADTSPRIEAALFVESLAQASRVAREAPVNVARHKRYTEAVEHGLQFIATLQYTEGNTLHFVEPYRARLVGGFHLSHQEGQLRIDYTQMALSALVAYLEYVAR